MRPPRLVHVTTTDMSLDWLLGRQLEAFADAGFEVVGVSAPGPHVDALRARGVDHVAVPSLTRSLDPRRDLRAGSDLVAVLRELAPDIVHTHNPKPGVLGRPAARRAGVPVVVNTVHGLYAQPDDPLARRCVVYGLERLAARFSDAELLQNEEDLPVLRRLGVPPERLVVLGNGIDLGRFDPRRVDRARRAALRAAWGVEPDGVVVGVVGRLVWEKGYREVFEMARNLDPRAVVVVVGPVEPDKRGAVDPRSLEAARARGVRLLGHRRDMVDLYGAFDVFVLASYREGYPRAAMEASAMGLPVVATDVRGCRQVVVDGRTGHLVAPRDAGALTAAVSRLVDDPGWRRRLGAAARERALSTFDESRVIATTLEVYERLLRRRAPGRSGVATSR